MTQETKTTKNDETAEQGGKLYILNIPMDCPNTAHTTSSVVSPEPVRPLDHRMQRGIVRWYSHQGYGFIDALPSTDGEAIYFHITAVKNRTPFKAGDAVIFDTAPCPKGLKAISVQRVDTKEETKCQQKI